MRRLQIGSLFLIIILAIITLSYYKRQQSHSISIGVLHSLSGTMAISESPVVDATLLAIEEINAQGGVLGRQIEPIVVDGESDWDLFAVEAEHLIQDENVAVVFGCWTSACRKTVKPVFEEYNHLLIYPIQYEGLEESPNIIYTGAAPNQQITPAVKWGLDNLGSRVFLVGSDYVFPHTANAIISDQVNSLQGEIVGEDYILLGSRDVESVVQHILETQPDFILNTINGDTNLAFFRALRERVIMPMSRPILATLGILTFLTNMDELLWPLILVSSEEMRTIPLGLSTFENTYQTAFGQLMAIASLAMLPTLLFFIFFQRQVIQGLTATGIKS